MFFRRYDPAYLLFVHLLDTRGELTKHHRFLSNPGAYTWNIHSWIMDDAKEDSSLKTGKSVVYETSTILFRQAAIFNSLENRIKVHLIAPWFKHVISLSFYKDKYDNYHVIYINKGKSHLEETILHFYISKQHKKEIVELIHDLHFCSQFIFENKLKKLAQLKNIVEIMLPQLKLKDRNNCCSSNGVKGTLRASYLLDSIENVDFRKYFVERVCKLDEKTLADLNHNFKQDVYERLWRCIFRYVEKFENFKPGQMKKHWGLTLAQGFYNHFQKARFSQEDEKLKIEIPFIKQFFYQCVERKFYASALLLIENLEKTAVAKSFLRNLINEFISAIKKESHLKYPLCKRGSTR